MLKRKKNVDRHGPRPLVNNPHLAEHSCFSFSIVPLMHFPCLNYKYICTYFLTEYQLEINVQYMQIQAKVDRTTREPNLL
jgi:hypothetical protein